MKNAFLLAAIIMLGACKPFPAEAEKAPPPSAKAQQESSVEAQAGQSDSDEDETQHEKPVVGEEITPGNLVISKSTNSDNYQSVKRINYPDASCWVVMNTKTWDGGISCIPKSQLPQTTP